MNLLNSMRVVLLAMVLSAVTAALSDIPPKPVYEPDYTPQFIPADEVHFYPNYNVAVFAGTRDSRYSNTTVQGPSNKTVGYYPTAKFEPISGGQKIFANEAKFTGVYGLTGNNITGDVFITDFCIIRRVNAQGIISVFAGSFEEQVRSTYYDDIFVQNGQHSCGFADNVAALKAKFNYPYGIATDVDGNLYVADTENLRIRKVAKGTNQTTTVAGNDTGVELHDNQQALISHIGYVVTIAAHGRTLYFVHRDLEIWRLDLASLLVTRVLASGDYNINPFGSLHASAEGTSLLFTWSTVYKHTGMSRIDLANANAVTVLRNDTQGKTSFLSVTGDLFGNHYYFVQELVGNSKTCSIYFHKQDENKEFLVAGGKKCGASSVGASSLNSKIMPGYFMYVNRYADLLWAQHYQEQYADQPFFMAGVMSLTLTQPSSQPTSMPTGQPSRRPTGQPSRRPTGQPSKRPTAQPSDRPTSLPTSVPSVQPTSEPSAQPTSVPSTQPTSVPTGQPSERPSRQPTSRPTGQPTGRPTRQPTGRPTGQPSARPTRQPTGQPSHKPSSHPTGQPSHMPSSRPTSQPSVQPTGKPSTQPSSRPSSQPTGQPTYQPTNGEITLTKGEIAGAVVGAIVGTFALSVAAAYGLVSYRAATAIPVPAPSQV